MNCFVQGFIIAVRFWPFSCAHWLHDSLSVGAVRFKFFFHHCPQLSLAILIYVIQCNRIKHPLHHGMFSKRVHWRWIEEMRQWVCGWEDAAAAAMYRCGDFCRCRRMLIGQVHKVCTFQIYWPRNLSLITLLLIISGTYIFNMSSLNLTNQSNLCRRFVLGFPMFIPKISWAAVLAARIQVGKIYPGLRVITSRRVCKYPQTAFQPWLNEFHSILGGAFFLRQWVPCRLFQFITFFQPYQFQAWSYVRNFFLPSKSSLSYPVFSGQAGMPEDSCLHFSISDLFSSRASHRSDFPSFIFARTAFSTPFMNRVCSMTT